MSYEFKKHFDITYKDAVDNILSTKREQRTIAVLTVVGVGGLYGAAKSRALGTPESLLAIATLFLIAIVVVGLLQRHIWRMRIRLRDIYLYYFDGPDRARLHLSPETPCVVQLHDTVWLYGLLMFGASLFVAYLIHQISPHWLCPY